VAAGPNVSRHRELLQHRRLADLAREHDAAFIVDDSHGTGVFGDERGSGATEADGIASRCDAIVSTCGKALAGFGAFVAAPRVVTDWLVNRARSFIFTTALPPLVLRLIGAGIDLCERGADRRLAMHRLADRLRDRLRAAGIDCLSSVGPIVPVVLGDNRVAVEVAAGLTARGFDVRAIRPPSVAPGTARLRLAVHADHGDEVIDRLATELLEIVDAVSATPMAD
jgi:7-keto-8-aminopelargonate synthetase-like enzyme